MTPISNPIGRLQSWYRQQTGTEVKSLFEAGSYQAEVDRFDRDFALISSLDGSSSDKDPRSGSVVSLAGSLLKTSEGFSLQVLSYATFGLSHQVSYSVNEEKGTVAVKQSRNPGGLSARSECTFLLDTREQRVLDYQISVGKTWA